MDTIHAGRPEAIRGMFSRIAGAYDRANDVLSLGIHKLWKKRLVRESGAGPRARVLDCATGTGDLAFLFERALGSGAAVVGTDFCEDMLVVARRKAEARSSRARFELADVTRLPYGDAEFDAASISFGIRNTPDPEKALSELGRVVRPGGAVMVLEFGEPESAAIRGAYKLYSGWVLPRVGGWLSGDPEAYRYLQRSSVAFPCGEAFLEMARRTGRYGQVRYRALQGGIAYLYRLEVK